VDGLLRDIEGSGACVVRPCAHACARAQLLQRILQVKPRLACMRAEAFRQAMRDCSARVQMGVPT